MATLTDQGGTWALTLGMPVIVRVRAINGANPGASDWSADNTVYGEAQVGPSDPPSGGEVGGSTSQTVIEITWTAISAGQGRALLINNVDTDYKVYWDYGTNEADYDVISESTGGATSFVMTSGFSPATTYYFKIAAFNEFGEGPLSAAIKVVTASVPVQLAAPSSIALDTDPLNVKTIWAATSDARGSPVTAYRVTFKGADGAFHIPNVAPHNGHACDPTTPITTTFCSMPMAVLTSAPFNLAAGALIVARVEALNERGWSTASPDSAASLTAITAPTAAPTLTRESSSSSSQVVVAWTALAVGSNGGSAVTEYEVFKGDTNTQYGSAIAANTVPLKAPADTGVTAGTTYTFYIRAKNAYGAGPFSAVFTITAASAPDALPSAAATALSGTSVVVTWATPTLASLHDSPLTAYIIEFQAANASWAEVAGCNGRSGSVLSNARCDVPMSALTGAPFLLPANTLIQVRVSVQNAIGTSAASAALVSGVVA